ncbi:MAG: glycosyltransferase family 4 protein [Candidatus Dojkabacteria bacterium]|nr:glycosyltransferase family 4 protein [Candidatus Dojkabacteria bacterium]
MLKISVISERFFLFENGEIKISPRGSNILLWNVIRILIKSKAIKFEIYQLGSEDLLFEYEGLIIHTLKSKDFFDYKERLKKISFDADVLHYNNIDLFSIKSKCITTATIHTNAFLEKDSARSWLNKNAFSFDRIVVVNDEYLKKYSHLEEKLILIKNGIPFEIFEFKEKKFIDSKDFKIFFPNFNSPKKNRDFALKLIKKLNKGETKYKLILAGESEDLGIDNGLYDFVGRVDYGKDMAKLYKDSFVTIIPSISESCSLCSLESMACGTVVIANDIPGISSYITNKKDGYLVSTNEIEEWISIIEMLANTPKKYSLIANNARNTVEKEYNSERMAYDYYNMWINLIQRKNGEA